MDSVLELIGPFGRYQKCIIIALGLIGALVSLNIYASVFTLAIPEFKCFTKNVTIEEDTCDVWQKMNAQEDQEESNLTSEYECVFDKTYYDNTVILIFGIFLNLFILIRFFKDRKRDEVNLREKVLKRISTEHLFNRWLLLVVYSSFL